MEKVDFKKEFKEFFKPSSKDVSVVDVPKFQFLMIDGVDARPESELFQQAIQALFAVSYKVKFITKKELSFDYVVMPLEGLWWADDMNDFMAGAKENWKWTLMIMQPDKVSVQLVNEAISLSKDKIDPTILNLLRLESFKEGRSAQIMHIGSFSEEHQNILKLHNQISNSGHSFDGQIQKHHEIYLSDFRKTAPEKLKTIIRQPFNA